MAILSISDALWAPDKEGPDNAHGIRRLWRHISAMVSQANTALAEWRLRREGLGGLSRLDDHSLRDIGVDRADLPRDPNIFIIPKEWFFPADRR